MSNVFTCVEFLPNNIVYTNALNLNIENETSFCFNLLKSKLMGVGRSCIFNINIVHRHAFLQRADWSYEFNCHQI